MEQASWAKWSKNSRLTLLSPFSQGNRGPPPRTHLGRWVGVSALLMAQGCSSYTRPVTETWCFYRAVPAQSWSKIQGSGGFQSHLRLVECRRVPRGRQSPFLRDLTGGHCRGAMPRLSASDRHLWETGSWLALITSAVTCLIFLRIKWLIFETRNRSPGKTDSPLHIIYNSVLILTTNT